jgi:hypothetical protein
MTPAPKDRAEWWQSAENRCPRAQPKAPDPLLLLHQHLLLLTQMVCNAVAGPRCTKVQHPSSTSGAGMMAAPPKGCFTLKPLSITLAVIAACIWYLKHGWVHAINQSSKLVCWWGLVISDFLVIVQVS